MAKQENKKAMTGAQRLKRSNDKKKAAGLRQIEVWVADERGIGVDDNKHEADRVRDYAAKQPITKLMTGNLNNVNYRT